MLKTDHYVVGIAHDDHVARGLALSPAFSPEIVAVESRPKELHLRPLAERCMSLSTHTAPIRQTRRSLQSANGRTKTGSALQFSARACCPPLWFPVASCISA